MIKELMDLAKTDEGNYKIDKSDVYIDKLIEEVTLQYKEFLLDLNYNGAIKGNRNKLIELIIIILDNAIKYTTAGDKIEIKAYSKEQIFYVLKKLDLKKENLVELYEHYIGNARSIWGVEDFDRPAIVAKQYGPYMVIFFNENTKDY